MNAIELPDMKWPSAARAYAWAEEEASRPDYRSPAAAIIRSMVADIMPRGQYGPQDYRDLALSILGAIAGIAEVYPREAFRYCYGQNISRADTLASVLAESMMERHQDRSYSVLKRVALVAAFRTRARYHWRQAPGLSWYARALGIERPSLYSGGWKALIDDCEGSFEATRDRGEALAKDALDPLGIL